ncbi:MAG TPA: hypothetical protein VNZ49_11930 [Bacteroidia bacterium]|jgi:hypothetical protein|nr:hypothetical protein [Bacteroidia bacterium]
MASKRAKTVYNVSYYNSVGELLDQTQIDENNEELAWELFAEFGHTRRKGYTVEIEPTEEE